MTNLHSTVMFNIWLYLFWKPDSRARRGGEKEKGDHLSNSCLPPSSSLHWGLKPLHRRKKRGGNGVAVSLSHRISTYQPVWPGFCIFQATLWRYKALIWSQCHQPSPFLLFGLGNRRRCAKKSRGTWLGCGGWSPKTRLNIEGMQTLEQTPRRTLGDVPVYLSLHHAAI